MAKANPDATAAPNKFPWPPVILLLGLLTAAFLNMVAPVPWPDFLKNSMTALFGFIILAAGITLELWTIAYFGTKKSNVLPTRPADKLLTGGPFKYSRNPIYLGNFLLTFSFAPIFTNLWFIAAALGMLIATGRLAISREERHLDAKFGQEWRDYAAKTRRWM